METGAPLSTDAREIYSCMPAPPSAVLAPIVSDNPMTTATEHHDAQLAAIKARHDEVRRQINDPGVTEVTMPGGMRWDQTGLSTVMVDEIGRFWNVDGNVMRMVFDPGPRNVGYSHGDRDTQTDHGFPAKD